ncbi:BMP-binding endothelial regulator protein-like [Pollicipes pollicipes]|uniref:BMP-binding endothelial regulator protein-like n=1 Tax=Pollicipes pollicipes TaxID=41117 RepID=UPI00188520AA|nr:BMP-binding endothelial regulator protein-like [Pollicipes pollicipes]
MAMLRLVTTVLLLTPAVIASGHGYSFPKGRPQPCSNEGEKVELGLIKTNPCITCKCQGGLVTCDREHCPMTETCHLVMLGQKIKPDSCCERCKGCQTADGSYKEGDEWRDPAEPCLVSHCFSGVITRSKVKVSRAHCQTVHKHTPCSHPLPAGARAVLPALPDCQLSGAVAGAGRNVTLPDDPCVACRCGKDGTQSCTRRGLPRASPA